MAPLKKGFVRSVTKWMKQRDPSEKQVRLQWAAIQRFKRICTFGFGVGVLVTSLCLDQIIDPSIVKLPYFDGRSLVT